MEKANDVAKSNSKEPATKPICSEGSLLAREIVAVSDLTQTGPFHVHSPVKEILGEGHNQAGNVFHRVLPRKGQTPEMLR